MLLNIVIKALLKFPIKSLALVFLPGYGALTKG